MTRHKNDVPESEGQKQTPQARSGVIVEDRVKSIDQTQPGEPFGEQKEGKTAAEGKALREQKP